MTERKQTVFKLCDRHEWLRSEGRIRMADFFAEDGPTDGPCVGDPCKIRPGLDLFIAEECRQQDWYDTAKGEHPFRWPVNAQKHRVTFDLEDV